MYNSARHKGNKSNGSENGSEGSHRGVNSAPRHKRGQNHNNRSGGGGGGGGGGQYQRHAYNSGGSGGGDNPMNGHGDAGEQQWNYVNGPWNQWNTHQHFAPHPSHHSYIYPGGDFRLYGTIMPLPQAVSPYGDYYGNMPTPPPAGSHLNYYQGPPQPYVDYSMAAANRGMMPAGAPAPYVIPAGVQQYGDPGQMCALSPHGGPGYGMACEGDSPQPQLSPSEANDCSDDMEVSNGNGKRCDYIQTGSACAGAAAPEKACPEDSSDSEEDSEDGSHYQNIISATFHNYDPGSTPEDAGRISKLILEVCQSGSTSCLICISNVKRTQAVWSCVQCSCMYHLQCIQKWARDRLEQVKLRRESGMEPPPTQPTGYSSGGAPADLVWNCPKCRYEYTKYAVPEFYLCFCGKTRDPESNPWLVPHTCGGQCDKPLLTTTTSGVGAGAGMEACGHKCTLLCHPGPCPPCPQTVMVKCQCGKSEPVPQRCSAPIWTCSKRCGKLLNCGKHECQELCHTGPCGQCKLTSVESCECGAEERAVLCTGEGWRCEKVCGRPFPCGRHECSRTCHSGDCGDCPTSGGQTCPCGAHAHPALDCSDTPPLCDSLCGKILECEQHQCEDLCHYDECGRCKKQVSKRCPCGKKTKLVPCTQNFTCETKCMRPRNCGRHQCKKKCCTGDCAPCENVCMLVLSCKNHKCQQRCHAGPCYPCQQVHTIYCPCRSTSIEVPCGREKLVKPPNCQKNCKRSPACHHPVSVPHKCHSGHCPPCSQQCGKVLDRCRHPCLSQCHSAVWTKHQPKKLLNNESVKFVQQEQPCGPCRTQVEISCFGQHETISIQCAKAKQYSCGSPCGRLLSCGNHTCLRACHIVQNAPDESTVKSAGADCDLCERGCELERPQGCEHSCALPCHLPPCPPCNIKVSKKCLCGHLSLLIPCNVWTEASGEERKELLNGNHPCPLQMDCGHACPLACHPPGACLPADQCSKRATAKCACGRIKQETLCKELPHTPRIPCDQICEQRLEKKRKNKEKSSNLNDSNNSEQYAEPASSENDKSPRHRSSATAAAVGHRSSASNQNKGSAASNASRPSTADLKYVKRHRGLNGPGAKSTHFYAKPYFAPLLLAFCAIFAGLYISLTAELS